VVVWCEGFTRLKCVGCHNVFEPVKKEHAGWPPA
jgi:hypothetical protein